MQPGLALGNLINAGFCTLVTSLLKGMIVNGNFRLSTLNYACVNNMSDISSSLIDSGWVGSQ
jgi:hypothetical protein